MAASINIARNIYVYQVVGSGTAVAHERRLLEEASQTFLQGTPVQIDNVNNNGYIIACPTMSNVALAKIAGFSIEPGANLSANGVALTQNLIQKVPNQANAVITPIGAPPNDGTTGFAMAIDTNYFVGVLGNSSNGANANVESAVSQIGEIYGLTKDLGNNFWYVDLSITTTTAGACVEILGLVDVANTVNGRVFFRVTHAAQQLNT